MFSVRSLQTDPTLRLTSSVCPEVSIGTRSEIMGWLSCGNLHLEHSCNPPFYRFLTLSVPSSSVASAMLSQNQTTISRHRESPLHLSTNPSVYSNTNSCKFVCIPHPATGLRFHNRKYSNSMLNSAGSQTHSTQLNRYHPVYDFVHVIRRVFGERELFVRNCRQISMAMLRRR